MSESKVFTFIGASTGCGYFALRNALNAGYTCIALCRTPSKLTDKLSEQERINLHVIEGNAHDKAVVARCLLNPSKPNTFVDEVVSTIGGAFSMATFSIDDTHVCENGVKTLFAALDTVRKDIGAGANQGPRITVISSTGISPYGRDIPMLMVPLYFLLKVPHEDKVAMENKLIESSEKWTIVRASLLKDGPEATEYPVIVGVEDPVAKEVVSKAIGYSITRADVGKWIFENLLKSKDDKLWLSKIATITY
jgi:hypothetical protein